jgi:hypothetical protein
MSNSTPCGPVVALTLTIASRSEPGPESAVVVTENVAAWIGESPRSRSPRPARHEYTEGWDTGGLLEGVQQKETHRVREVSGGVIRATFE